MNIFRNTVFKTRRKFLFYVGFIALPVVQFAVFYVGVNFNSILLAFRDYTYADGYGWAGFDNFKRLFAMADTSNWPVTLYIFNSLVSTVCVVVGALLMCAAAGYVLSKKNFRGKRTIQRLNQAALMFVPVAVAVPRFLIIKQLGLMNSFWSQILPLLAMPVGLFLVQQFIDQLPNSLLEAAQIDGCSDYGILFRIVIPIIKPALATVAILAFQSAWSSVEASQMFIDSEKIKTFAYYMSAVTSPTGNTVDGQAMAAAAAVIMFVPNVVLFVLMQSKVMNTVAHSGIK